MSGGGFRVAVLAASSTLVVAAGGCSKRQEAAPFSCEQLQLRAECCQEQALAIVKSGVDKQIADGGRDDRELQFKMFEVRFREKLRTQQTRKLCEKYQGGADPAYAWHLAQLRECYARSGCDDFARCMLEQ